MSAGEEALAMMLRAYGVAFEREYRFAPPRRWRADFAVPGRRLLVEVQGGHWIKGGGRHNRSAGYAADLERQNAAQLAGWTILQYTTERIRSGEAIVEIMEYLQRGGPA